MPYGVHCKQLFEITTDKLRYSTRQHDVLFTIIDKQNIATSHTVTGSYGNRPLANIIDTKDDSFGFP